VGIQEGILNMKRILWMTLLLVLALPMAAFADSNVDLTNLGGTLVGTSAGLTLTDSTLIHMNGTLGNLGTVEFATGALLSGTLQGNATFAGGGSFTIVSNTNGTLFSGAFDGPVTWSLTTLANGTHNYTLTGAISGSWMGGATVYGATSQLTINTGRGFFNGSTSIASGDTNIVVPEPGSLTLMGTGLLGFAGVLRRKLKA
jgi:PEP-CTERM motif